MAISYHSIKDPLKFDYSDRCPICHCEFTETEVINGEVFVHDEKATHPGHRNCIRDALKISSLCPVCRINIYDYSSLFTWKERAVMNLKNSFSILFKEIIPMAIPIVIGTYMLGYSPDVISSIALGLFRSRVFIVLRRDFLGEFVITMPVVIYAINMFSSTLRGDLLSLLKSGASCITYLLVMVHSKTGLQAMAISSLAGGVFNLHQGFLSAICAASNAAAACFTGFIAGILPRLRIGIIH